MELKELKTKTVSSCYSNCLHFFGALLFDFCNSIRAPFCPSIFHNRCLEDGDDDLINGEEREHEMAAAFMEEGEEEQKTGALICPIFFYPLGREEEEDVRGAVDWHVRGRLVMK